MSYLDRTLAFLHQQGWSYGLIRYLDKVNGAEVRQIDAHKGDRWEIGRGSTWTEAARDLVKKIYDVHTMTIH
jgi:hypothetical protein